MKKSLLALSLVSAFALHASDEQWQTITTDNFKVHYPKAYHAWATSTANELELVRDKVLEQQNRALDKMVDVVVFDPLNRANGFALPTSNQPLMAFFATPPQSDTVISNNSGWQQLLVLHEYIHLVHLAQPTRSKWRQQLREMWDLYDLSHINMPRWVAEGYATLLESQMTGRGRLHDNYVESLITQFAKEGALPRYSKLNHASEDYMAGSMAYLMGVRYLQWLEDNYSKQTLDSVWTRMQAVEKRDFDDAFEGVFGAPASKLYRRFVAEYTHQALSLEAQQADLKTSLWLDLKHYQTSPTLSPDESRFAVVSRDKEGDTRLTIYDTADNEKAQQEFEQQQQALLEDDPLDVIDKAPEVFEREQKLVVNQIDRKGIMSPQWLDDSTIVFGAFSVANNAINTRHQDLFRFNIKSGEITQLTQFANIRRFTLADNGIVYAEQAKYGYSELVEVNLDSGIVTPITEKRLETVYDFPTVNGNQLAYLKMSLNQNWTLWVKDLNTQRQKAVPMPAGYQFLSYPTWSADGAEIYYVAGVNGQTNLYRYHFANDMLQQLTHGQQVVSYPMPSQKHGLLYMATNSQGPDVFKLAPDATTTEVKERAQSELASVDKALQPALPEAKIYQQAIGDTRDYDVTAQSVSFSLGEQYNSASTLMFHLGLKGGDLLNQLTWQLGGAFDTKDALSGAFAEAKYKAQQFEFLAHGFSYDLDSQKQYQRQDTTGQVREGEGIYLEASMPYRHDQFLVNGFIAYNYTDYEQAHNQWAKVGLSQQWSRDWQSFAIGQSIKASWYDGRSSAHDWDGYDVEASIFGKLWSLPLYAKYQDKKRNDGVLSLGGFDSSLIKEKAHSDFVLAQELPFLSIDGEQYQSFETGFAFKPTQPRFYYQEHKMDSQDYAKSYGIKWQMPMSFGLGPAVLNDVNVNLGLVKVEGDHIQDEMRGWLGLWYSL